LDVLDERLRLRPQRLRDGRPARARADRRAALARAGPQRGSVPVRADLSRPGRAADGCVLRAVTEPRFRGGAFGAAKRSIDTVSRIEVRARSAVIYERRL